MRSGVHLVLDIHMQCCAWRTKHEVSRYARRSRAYCADHVSFYLIARWWSLMKLMHSDVLHYSVNVGRLAIDFDEARFDSGRTTLWAMHV